MTETSTHHVVLTVADPTRLTADAKERFASVFKSVCGDHNATLAAHHFDDDRAHLHVDVAGESFSPPLLNWIRAHSERAFNDLPMNDAPHFRWSRAFHAGAVDEDDSGEPEAAGTIPADLESVGYRELQDLAKAHDIPATQSGAELQDALAAAREDSDE